MHTPIIPIIPALGRRQRGSLIVTIDLGASLPLLAAQRLLRCAEYRQLPVVWGVAFDRHRRLIAKIIRGKLNHELGLRLDPRLHHFASLQKRVEQFHNVGIPLQTVVAVGRNLPPAWRRRLPPLAITGIAALPRARRQATLRGGGIRLWEVEANWRVHDPSSHHDALRRIKKQVKFAAEHRPQLLHLRISLGTLAHSLSAIDQIVVVLEMAADYRDRGMLSISNLSESISQLTGIDLSPPARLAA